MRQAAQGGGGEPDEGAAWAVTAESRSRFCQLGFSYFFTGSALRVGCSGTQTASARGVNCTRRGSQHRDDRREPPPRHSCRRPPRASDPSTRTGAPGACRHRTIAHPQHRPLLGRAVLASSVDNPRWPEQAPGLRGKLGTAHEEGLSEAGVAQARAAFGRHRCLHAIDLPACLKQATRLGGLYRPLVPASGLFHARSPDGRIILSPAATRPSSPPRAGTAGRRRSHRRDCQPPAATRRARRQCRHRRGSCFRA